MALMRPVLRAHGVSEQQWRILRALSRTEPLDKTSLSTRAMLLMPSLLRMLKELERLGFVSSVPAPGNRRMQRILLTSDGARLVRRVSADIEKKNLEIRQIAGAALVDDITRALNLLQARLLMA